MIIIIIKNYPPGVFQVSALVTETGATHDKRITVQIYCKYLIIFFIIKLDQFFLLQFLWKIFKHPLEDSLIMD